MYKQRFSRAGGQAYQVLQPAGEHDREALPIFYGYQRVEEARLRPGDSGSRLTTSIAASVPVATTRTTSTAPSAVARATTCAAAPATNARGVPVPARARMISPRL